MAAFAPDLPTFESGRNFAAWLGFEARYVDDCSGAGHQRHEGRAFTDRAKRSLGVCDAVCEFVGSARPEAVSMPAQFSRNPEAFQMSKDCRAVAGSLDTRASLRALSRPLKSPPCALMLEQNDEWAVSRRYMPVEKLTAICTIPTRRR